MSNRCGNQSPCTSALTESDAGGWGQEGWWECEQQEGELIYGVGGMLHAVLSLTDSFSLSEQMLGPTDFSGSVTFRRLADEGLVEMGLCDAGVEEFRLETVKQLLALAAAADWTKKIEHAEIRDPAKRVVSKRERAYLVSTWLASCAAVWAVRRDLWEDWSECKELYRTCGSFVETTLDFRQDYVWYPEMRVRKQRKGKLKKRKSG